MFFSRRRARGDSRRTGFRDRILRANARSGRGPGGPWAKRIAGLAATLTAAGGAAALAWLGMAWLGHELLAGNDLFRIREIRVDIRGTTLTREHVIEYASLNACSNLFALNLARVRRDFLRDVPQARSMALSRRLPGTLLVEVTERLPLARIEKGGGSFLAIDRDGVVLAAPSGASGPAITGHGIRPLAPGQSLDATRVMNAVDVLDLCETAAWGEKVRIATVDVARPDQLTLTLAGGERIAMAWDGMAARGELSRRGLETKMTKLVEILKAASARGKKLDTADLTLDRNIPVQYR